jgi:hypothetical protein
LPENADLLAVTKFDPELIERYAARLEQKAGSRVTRLTVVGGLFGAFLGGMPLFSLLHTAIPHRYGYALLIAGAAAGGYLGFSLGESRAAGLRLQAQVALHQLELERLVQRLEPEPAAAAPAPPPVVLTAVAADWQGPPTSAAR